MQDLAKGQFANVSLKTKLYNGAMVPKYLFSDRHLVENFKVCASTIIRAIQNWKNLFLHLYWAIFTALQESVKEQEGREEG